MRTYTPQATEVLARSEVINFWSPQYDVISSLHKRANSGPKFSGKSCNSYDREDDERATAHVKYVHQRLGTAELPEEQASEHEGLD